MRSADADAEAQLAAYHGEKRRAIALVFGRLGVVMTPDRPAATVVQPLRRLYADRYAVAPYSVLVDPVRARQIVCERGFGGFSAKIAYIFMKQLEEADVICLSPSFRAQLRTYAPERMGRGA